MKLLSETRPSELPAEALMARLRCRRAAIDLGVDQGTEPAPADLARWVYQRLNRRLRRHLEPFLDLLAMRDLTLALRYALAGEMPPPAVTNSTLLTEPLQLLTIAGGDGKLTIAQLEAALASSYPFAAGLTLTYQNQGPGGVEQQLADGILQHGLSRTSKGIINKTLSYLADMRNCLTITKLWSWQVSRPPIFTSGGTISATRLKRICATNDRDRLVSLIARLTGEPLSSAANVDVEQSLLVGLTRLLRRAGRDPLSLAVVIEYLWKSRLAAHNQALRQALSPDREELLAEVLLR